MSIIEMINQTCHVAKIKRKQYMEQINQIPWIDLDPDDQLGIISQMKPKTLALFAMMDKENNEFLERYRSRFIKEIDTHLEIKFTKGQIPLDGYDKWEEKFIAPRRSCIFSRICIQNTKSDVALLEKILDSLEYYNINGHLLFNETDINSSILEKMKLGTKMRITLFFDDAKLIGDPKPYLSRLNGVLFVVSHSDQVPKIFESCCVNIPKIMILLACSLDEFQSSLRRLFLNKKLYKNLIANVMIKASSSQHIDEDILRGSTPAEDYFFYKRGLQFELNNSTVILYVERSSPGIMVGFYQISRQVNRPLPPMNEMVDIRFKYFERIDLFALEWIDLLKRSFQLATQDYILQADIHALYTIRDKFIPNGLQFQVLF